MLYRQIAEEYRSHYELLFSSKLYDTLVKKDYLVSHTDVKNHKRSDAWKVIRPEEIPFISYPYEWSFTMLKEAALLTLRIQKEALELGMTLKDATPFNVQFRGGKPIFIDTLSFETYEEGKPWIAYKQFVEQFLSPLALMALVDIRLGGLSEIFLDGVPVDVAAKLLPFKSRFNLNLLFHIHAHASSKRKHSDTKLSESQKNKQFKKISLLGLIDNLESSVRSLEFSPKGTQWEDYYEKDRNNYNSGALKHKGELVKSYLNSVKPRTVWDLGANTGHFSKIAADTGAFTIAFDNDYGAIEKGSRELLKSERKNMLTLYFDVLNPTPPLGWENAERQSILERGPADSVLALALIHHLAITHNVPLSYLASFFAQTGKYLIIEFVPKEDSQVQKLLANREDIFLSYDKKGFEEAFGHLFTIKRQENIKGSKRTLYLMEKK